MSGNIVGNYYDMDFITNREYRGHIGSLWGIHERLDKLRGNMSKQALMDDASDGPDESLGDTSTLPPTYIVIHVSADIRSETLEWLVSKIRGKKDAGGAELIVLKQPYDPHQGVIALHVSASKIKLLEVAEEMELVIKDIYGKKREFTINQLPKFLPDGKVVEDILSIGERQSIVMHELENIRAREGEEKIYSYNYKLYEGQSILQVCKQKNLVLQVFPLHDDENLKKLGQEWYLAMFKKQPLEEIRSYFGESVALYFAFLGFYTTALLVPMCLGFLQILVSMETVPFFCIFNVVWVTVFLEVWRRRSNELAYNWGTISMTSQSDEPRPNFRGQMTEDQVTKKKLPQYPRWKTNAKMYGVSFPIVILCMIGGFIMMIISFWWEEYLRDSEIPWMSQLPSIIYSALIYIVNLYYRKLATYLTEWENHRTEVQFYRHRISKLILFEFVNNFMALFYIAFVIQDMEMLKVQLVTMLVVLQILNNFQEACLPIIVKYCCQKMTDVKKSVICGTKLNKKFSAKKLEDDKGCEAFAALKLIPEIQEDDPRIKEANKEAEMEAYESTYDDYLELFIQFGYVILFSSVYPLAAFFAVCNNVLEIRSDAFKLCRVFQRPVMRRVKDIGPWQRAFEMLGALSIMTNCGLLCLSPQMRRQWPELSHVEWIMMFVLLEHLLLGMRFLLHITIPDKPEAVRVGLAKKNYTAKQALKIERSEKNRQLLTRRFKTVHGPHSH